MKRRIFAWLAVVSAAWLLACAARAEGAPSVTLLRAITDGNTLSVTYQLQNPLPGQEITCLITDAAGQRVLQAEQYTANGDGVQTVYLPLDQAPAGFAVRLGGTGIQMNKTGVCTDVSAGFTARAVGIRPGQTAGDLLREFAEVSRPAVTRGGQPLAPADTVAIGDQVTGQWPDGTAFSLPAVVFGDVNTDGTVTAADALTVLKAAVGKLTLTDLSLAAADYRQNGTVNAAVALEILKYSVGKITGL